MTRKPLMTMSPYEGSGFVEPSLDERFGPIKAWTVSFRLWNPQAKRSFTLSKAATTSLLTVLRGTAPVVTTVERGFALTFNVIGDLDESVRRSTELVWSALEEASLDGFSIAQVKVVNHEDFDRRSLHDLPKTYYGMTECAQALELSKQRISQLVTSGEFPAPDALIGSRPAWEEGRIRNLAKRLQNKGPRGRRR